MCFKTSNLNPNRALAYKLMLVSSLVAFWIFYPLFVGAYVSYTEDFDEFEIDTDLDGQDNWATYNTGVWVRNTQSVSEPHSAEVLFQRIARRPVADLEAGEYSGEMWLSANTSELNFAVRMDNNTAYACQFSLSAVENKVFHGYIEGDEILSGLDLKDKWNSFSIDFFADTDTARFCVNATCSEYLACDYHGSSPTFDTIDGINVKGADAGKQTTAYIDDLYFGDVQVAELLVWGEDPESATEINDLNTNFTFGFEGLADYDGLLISFYNQATRIHTNALRFDKTDIGVEGEKVVNLADFEFYKNGDWHLNAIAFVEVPETYEGLYLTGRYITEYTQNVVSPEYYLVIDIEGFPVVFEMENWGDWYDEYSKFDEATPLFERVATLFTPTFNNIGEFGQTISDYFEVDKAYSRGHELGLAIPIFAYYTTAIEMFFGGLPIIKLFMMIMLLLTGIFIFKIVMKFIPFLS